MGEDLGKKEEPAQGRELTGPQSPGPGLTVTDPEVFAAGGNQLVLATFLVKSMGTGRIRSSPCVQKLKVNHWVLEGRSICRVPRSQNC